jgi:hypothetical protein
MKTSELLQEKAKGTPPEWAAKEQAEFRKFCAQFGFHLTTIKPENSNLQGDMNVGGTFKDKDDNELMGKEHRLAALKKGLAKYLLDKAKEGRFVKIFTKNYWRHDPRYIHPEDTLRSAEQAVNSAVYFKPKDRWSNVADHLSIYWAISEPKK